MSEEPTKQGKTRVVGRAIESVKWAAIGQYGSQLLTFITALVLARLLSPEDFGLIGILGVFLVVSDSIVDFGFGSALIQDRGATNRDFQTVQNFNIIIGVLMYLILFLLSPYIADHFAEQSLRDVSRALFVVVVLNSYRAAHVAKLLKGLRYKGIAIAQITGSLGGASVAIVMAVTGFGVWSLVGKWVVGTLLNSVIVSLYSGVGLSCGISKDRLRKYWQFGSMVMVTKIMDAAARQIDSFLIGQSFGIHDVGYYTRARLINQMPSKNTTAVVSRLFFPLFSERYEDKKKLYELYQKSMRLIAFIILPIMTLIVLKSELVVAILLGEKWFRSSEMLEIMGIFGSLLPLSTAPVSLVLASGKGGLYAKLEAVKKIVLLVALVVGIQFNIITLIWLLGVAAVIGFLSNLYAASITTEIQILKQLNWIMPPIVIAVMSGLGLLTVSEMHPENWSWHAAGIASYIAVYISLFFLYDRQFIIQFFALIRKIIVKS